MDFLAGLAAALAVLCLAAAVWLHFKIGDERAQEWRDLRQAQRRHWRRR